MKHGTSAMVMNMLQRNKSTSSDPATESVYVGPGLPEVTENPQRLHAAGIKAHDNNVSLGHLFMRLSKLHNNLQGELMGRVAEANSTGEGQVQAPPESLHYYLDMGAQLIAACDELVSQIESLV